MIDFLFLLFRALTNPGLWGEHGETWQIVGCLLLIAVIILGVTAFIIAPI